MPTIRVLEHERLRVGQEVPAIEGGTARLSAAAFESLVRFHDTRPEPVFRVGHRCLTFRQYVGFVQVGGLGIEILPKADAGTAGPGARQEWHDALLRMLRVALRMPVHMATPATVGRDRSRLLDLFVDLFLDEVEGLLRRGLARAYRTEASNRTGFSGRLLVREQLRHNLVRQDRQFVERTVFDARNLPNRILRGALDALARAPLHATQEGRRRAALLGFPEEPGPRLRPEDLTPRPLDRRTQAYEKALLLARMILTGWGPNLRSGDDDLLALLFDMNALWEAYVLALLRRHAGPDLHVRGQVSRLFWSGGSSRSTLRPDILVVRKGTDEAVAVLDTKWKVPKQGRPASGDLQQMFAYNELFGTPRAVLLYPETHSGSGGVRGRFRVGGHSCETAHLPALVADVAEEVVRLLEDLLAPAPRESHSPLTR